MTRKILITGQPGVGKTTLIRSLADRLLPEHPVGFFTREIRKGGIRKGFELASLDGHTGILSHVDIISSARVGKYGVDIVGFERFLDDINLTGTMRRPLIIDEIGKMECLSEEFRTLVIEILDSDRLLIATIAQRGDRFIESIKARNNVTLLTLTRDNRDGIGSQVMKLFEK